MSKLLPDPSFDLVTLADDNLCSNNSIFIGCVSYEERCKGAITRLINKGIDEATILLFDIEDNECSHLPWLEECKNKTSGYWDDLLEVMNSKESHWNIIRDTYKMSNRREHVLILIETINKHIAGIVNRLDNVRVLLDITCIPSYFALQLLKDVLSNSTVSDLVVLYTKPFDYPEKILKISPHIKTRPDFLQLFGHDELKVVKWIVGAGFDNDSVANAIRIQETIDVDSTYLIVPFPGYRPEYVMRTLTENDELLQKSKQFYFAQADDPFKTFSLIQEIVSNNNDFILSSFGPKPMAVGFAMAAHKLKLPILHVQATDYNPRFSSGTRETSCFWIKQNCEVWDI